MQTCSPVDWDAIRFVLAVARAGSCSRAARELDVDQTTVSRRIAALEAALDVRLFERLARGWVPTAAAARILEHAERMEGEAHAVSRGLAGDDARLAGRLRVTMSEMVAAYLVLPALPAFRAAHPAIDLELIAGDDALDLGAREADVAVRVTPAVPETLLGKKLATLRYAVYAAASYLKAHPDPAAAGVELATWLTTEGQPPWAQRNFPKATVALRVGSPMSLLAAVRSGVGLGLLPCFVGEQEPTLVRVPMRTEEPGWHVWVLTHPDLRRTARVRRFREFVATTLRQQASLLTPHFPEDRRGVP